MEKGIFLNIDINSVVYPFLDEIAGRKRIEREMLYPFIDQYADTLITDISLCVFCQYSNTPSVVFTDAYAKYAQEIENGLPVNYKDIYGGINKLWQEHGLDVYDIWFKRIRKLGLSGWLSVRMNDAHEPEKEASFLRSDFHYLAKQQDMFIGQEYGYFRKCFDYAKPLVRHMMLAYIAEQLDRYDVDGLELDWLREIYCFDYLKYDNACEIMNEFMRDVKKIVLNAEEKWGHSIKILVRLMRDMEQNTVFGFDVKTWISEGLVDIVTVGPRWATCDSDIPIEKWKRQCGDVPVYAGLEVLINRQAEVAMATAEVVRGFAAQFFCAGADKLYLFNYFQNPHTPMPEWEEIYKTAAGSQLLSLPRRHVVTYQDLWPVGYKPYRPLPKEIEAGSSYELVLQTGTIEEGRLVRLILGFKGRKSSKLLEVSLNGKALCGGLYTDIESFDASTGMLSKNGYADAETHFLCWEGLGVGKREQRISVRNNKERAVVLTYAELAVDKKQL